MIVVPSVDIEGGIAVKRIRGAKGTGLSLGDPYRLVEEFAGMGFPKIHIVDLEGASTGRPSHAMAGLVSYARELGLSVRVGGGVRSLAAASSYCLAGAREIVLGTLWASNPLEASIIASRASCTGVAAVEEKEGKVVVAGWTASLAMGLEEAITSVRLLGFKSILYTDVDVEGTMRGPRPERVSRARRLAGSERLIYSGGVSEAEHLDLLAELGVDEVVVGMALYTGSIPVEVALSYA